VERLVVVLGAGRAPLPLEAVEETLSQLRGRFGKELTLGVAALGPAMCRLAGRIGDLVFLNWATPQRIQWSRTKLDEGTRKKPGSTEDGEPKPVAAAYVRVAMGEMAEQLLEGEAETYAKMPHYRRHFKAMDHRPGIIGLNEQQVAHSLQPYDKVLDETVIRAVASPGSLEPFIALAEACAP